ncbi:DUF4159 domain-containing protein [Lentibacter algarum]|uniref:DUF4159 domain-containing protein n=1 Tax=Lentibacter algarum TaxID=576131 RepID=UPI001C06A9A2|nr:DUF4159 domain-containing protein [Lentibacter algarum]MBU2981182.1 DUF4159 domain-containing protein [Lentibacter algarum]
MSVFGILFTAPYMLLALLGLPLLWLLLRAVPPAPIRHMFPAVVLLLGLKDEDSTADRTPWWLLLLRLVAVAAVIIGLAGPVLNPKAESFTSNDRLLIALDASWASARDWDARIQYLEGVLQQAGRNGQAVSIVSLSRPEPFEFLSAQEWATRLPGFQPSAWGGDEGAIEALPEDGFDTLWLSDGVARESRAALIKAFESHGRVQVVQSERPLMTLASGQNGEGKIALELTRLHPSGQSEVTVQAVGLDPTGVERVLSTTRVNFDAGAKSAQVLFDVPAEIQARITQFSVQGALHAGAVLLADDSLKRREIALVSGRENREGLELLSPLHYLEKALVASSDLLRGTLSVTLTGNPDVVIMADIAEINDTEEQALTAWVERGGLLVRFAGPRLAASEISRTEEHPLMPVRLRAGGRVVGGAMSWGEPKSLAPFEEISPFFGLAVDDDLRVTAQVVAQPDPQLAKRVIARLADGTPLVTRKKLGQGHVVLFHISANAEWSNLPLSGLFVRMLERLSVATSLAGLQEAELEGTVWQPVKVLNGFGQLNAADNLPGVDGAELLSGALGVALQPGLFEGPGRLVARNVMQDGQALNPAVWPASVSTTTFTGVPERALAGAFFATALLLLALDVLATLGLSGRLVKPAMAALMIAAVAPSTPAEAQDATLTEAAGEIVLAHVITGDEKIDDIALAGLRGLSDTLFFRTSVEPELPRSVNLETDEIAFYPLLYWPVSPDQPTPSAGAYENLNAYLRRGGMIVFDTRDADVARFGAASPSGKALRRLAAPLDIPELEPVPEDHVLTRAFYLLQDFPGRHNSRDVWVEAAPAGAQRAEGMPFRNLNDGVTPVIIGGNDWAAAWAIDARGAPLLPIGRGYSGSRQRELAYRFGVNLVMHVLTGNYKSDQVHVPALLERLGQ